MLLGLLSLSALAPPPLTKSDRRAAKFREMLASVTLTDERLAMLDDAGLRTLLAGVQGAAELPLVVDAFTIVYSDVAPVRLAGDLIFRSIAKRVRGADDAATKLSRELAAAIDAARRPSAEDIVRARELFDLVDRDGSGTLSRDELLASGLLRSADVDGEAVDRFMREVDADESGEVDFIEFMLLASRVLFDEENCEDECSFAERAPPLIDALEIEGAPSVLFDEAKIAAAESRRDERFETMLESVASWELDETDETRFGVVVRGAQAGGKDARVVSALRHLYTGYAPIRPGAHLIFKLMDAHIGRNS